VSKDRLDVVVLPEGWYVKAREWWEKAAAKDWPR
jgi:hypothetical protein